MSVEVSVVIPSRHPRSEIPAVRALERDDSADHEVIVRGDDGAATARNRGVEAASADKLVFLDDDAEPRPGYLRRAADQLETHAVVAGRVIDPGEDYFSDAAATQTYDQGARPHPTTKLVGCNFAARRKVWEQVGGFDSTLEWGHEDTLFAERTRETFEIHYDPELIVEHRFRSSVLEHWRKEWRYGRADVGLARIQDRPILENWREAVPVSLQPTARGTLVFSMGRAIRLTNTALELVRSAVGVPWRGG